MPADDVQVEFALGAPTAAALGNLGAKSLVQAERHVGQFVRLEGGGQVGHGAADGRQVFPELALQVLLHGGGFDRLVLDDGPDAVGGVPGRQGSPAHLDPELLAQADLLGPAELAAFGRPVDAKPAAFALCVESRQALAEAQRRFPVVPEAFRHYRRPQREHRRPIDCDCLRHVRPISPRRLSKGGALRVS
ncbi:MAG: hypothetical protein AMK72_14535 [Planctomycetes bacterium SM23_25]|nr:MAG: hypothetical protein AMK72_14535 [Planctomycetes bacterium SM23_25]